MRPDEVPPPPDNAVFETVAFWKEAFHKAVARWLHAEYVFKASEDENRSLRRANHNLGKRIDWLMSQLPPMTDGEIPNEDMPASEES